MAQMIPTVAFADVAQTGDPVQKQWFRVTGGKDFDCCVDGCGCTTAQPYGACVRACVKVWVWVWVWVWVYKSIYIYIYICIYRCAWGTVGLDEETQGGSAAEADIPAQQLPQLDLR